MANRFVFKPHTMRICFVQITMYLQLHLITANLRGCRSTKTCDLSFVRGMRGTIFSDLQVNVFQLVLVLFHNILVLSVKQFDLTIIINIYSFTFGIYRQITWIIPW